MSTIKGGLLRLTSQASNGKWYNIIKRTGEELSFYGRQGIVPSLRKMYYRLIELGVLTKTDSNYKHLAEKTAEARSGVDSTYMITGRP